MKTAKYFRMWSVFCALICTKLILAQSPCTPSLSFSAGPAGTISYTVTSPSPIAPGLLMWNFGNGTGAWDTLAVHTATYLSDGVYNVSVTYSVNGMSPCSGTTNQSITVSNAGCNLTASFMAAASPTTASVYITNTSTGMSAITSATWDYGDGSAPFVETPPSGSSMHTYTANGTYIITLMEDNNTPACVSTQTMAVVINPQSCVPTFSYSVGAGGVVSFTATATGNGTIAPATYNWMFQTATMSGTNLTQPTYTFASDGVYYVSLLYVSNSNTCTGFTTQSITVNTAGCNLVANFASAPANNSVTILNNTSTGISAISVATWDFGDGSTPTVQPLPANTIDHVYTTNGTYLVTLSIDNNTSPTCVSTKTLLVNVAYGAPCVANAGFTMTPSGTPQVWNATPNAPANLASVTWLWGDGSSSNTLYTSHTYSAAGTYSICLTATASCGDADTSCFSYAIYRTLQVGQDLNVIRVDVIDPSAPTGIKTVSAENAEFSILPNPNTGSFQLKLGKVSGSNVKIAVYDLVGKQVYEAEGEASNGSFNKTLQLDQAANGVYVIRISSDNRVLTKKMVISRQ